MSKRCPSRRPSVLPQPDLFGEGGANAAPRTASAKARPKRVTPPAPSKLEHVGPGLLNVRQAAVRLGLSKSTLDKMRCAGKGPKFIKSTDRAVRYDPVDLDAWIDRRRRQATHSNA